MLRDRDRPLVLQDDDLVAGAEQLFDNGWPDKTCTACDGDLHGGAEAGYGKGVSLRFHVEGWAFPDPGRRYVLLLRSLGNAEKEKEKEDPAPKAEKEKEKDSAKGEPEPTAKDTRPAEDPASSEAKNPTSGEKAATPSEGTAPKESMSVEKPSEKDTKTEDKAERKENKTEEKALRKDEKETEQAARKEDRTDEKAARAEQGESRGGPAPQALERSSAMAGGEVAAEAASQTAEDRLRRKTAGIATIRWRARSLLLLVVAAGLLGFFKAFADGGKLALSLPITFFAAFAYSAADYGAEWMLSRASGAQTQFKLWTPGAFALAVSTLLFRAPFGYPGYVSETDVGHAGDDRRLRTRAGLRSLAFMGAGLALTLPFLHLCPLADRAAPDGRARIARSRRRGGFGVAIRVLTRSRVSLP